MKPRILIVDDAAMARRWLTLQLSDRYEVLTAVDGQEGVEKALATRPHLILLDVIMPRMDGLDACRALRAEEATAATPIILVTSQGDEWDVEAGYVAGCTDYITKPVDRAEFQAKVDSWLAVAAEGAA